MKTVVDLVSALKTYFLNKDKDIYEVMGQNGAKNLFDVDLETLKALNTAGTWNGDSYTYRGITWTFNASNKTLTANGTATGTPTIIELPYVIDILEVGKEYILSGAGVGSTDYAMKLGTLADINNGGESKFIYDGSNLHVQCLVRNNASVNNIVYKPMLRLASNTDPTYQPFAETNQQLTEDTTALLDNLEVNGAVNMLDSAIATQVANDITVTNNGDGSYTVNCTSTSHYSQNFFSTKKVTLPKGTYKWTASADGKSPIGSNNCYAFIRGVNGTVDWYRSYGDTGYHYGIITLTQDSKIEFGINVAANVTVSDLTFKPMITVPSYYKDYVPYAKSNKELTKYSQYYCGGARRKLFGLENNTSFTAKIPKSVCALYEQFNIKLRGNNNNKYYDSVIFVNCTRNNDAINNSSIINNADTGVTINASIDGDFVKIVVSGLTTYVRLELEYFNGNMINDPLQDDWQFIAGA